jgi:hypothetical protein
VKIIMPTISDLYKKSIAADNAFSSELARVFGIESYNARYDGRGESTPELLQLAKAKKAADLELHNAISVYRGENPISA